MKVESQALEVLRAIGITSGQTVLDFGCGPGTYSIQAARLVGEQGKVYALDKDGQSLDKLLQNARRENLANVERMDTSGELEINLADESVDMILLFDVLHEYYLPDSDQRERLLNEFHRTLKPDGVLSVYPKHMESTAKDEIESANFYLASEYSGTLIHENRDLERGQILNFKKKSRQHLLQAKIVKRDTMTCLS
jgi:ubiquinone/menaquinone biosynthesis C-methylase UbiE